MATAPLGHQEHQVPVASSPITNFPGAGTTASTLTINVSSEVF